MLRQKGQEFGAFFAEFQRLALESKLPEESLPTLLENAVSRELREMLLHNPPLSHDYHPLARHLQDLENRRRYYQSSIAGAPGKTPAAASRYAPRGPVTTATAPAPGTPTTATAEPMDLSRHRRPDRVSPNRKERRECFRCGSAEHFVAQCPHPDNRNFRVTRNRTPSPRSLSPLRQSRTHYRSVSPPESRLNDQSRS